jgi:hypothetical protein
MVYRLELARSLPTPSKGHQNLSASARHEMDKRLSIVDNDQQRIIEHIGVVQPTEDVALGENP